MACCSGWLIWTQIKQTIKGSSQWYKLRRTTPSFKRRDDSRMEWSPHLALISSQLVMVKYTLLREEQGRCVSSPTVGPSQLKEDLSWRLLGLEFVLPSACSWFLIPRLLSSAVDTGDLLSTFSKDVRSARRTEFWLTLLLMCSRAAAAWLPTDSLCHTASHPSSVDDAYSSMWCFQNCNWRLKIATKGCWNRHRKPWTDRTF